MREVESPQWRKSSFCASGNCVEVAKVDGQYLLRDSKNPDVPAHAFTGDEWTAFVAGVRAGEFSF
ncbi:MULTISPECIES: DUF397 domain-containing protein [Paractinoplanes]|jgi:hypothetical protein|uniref:DUF397 domain-containing protein n=1 Tax=Paractinoplanes hotanensis TaxID=2906497 RepID=A0ABT0Y214_9ACTN|nr:MULTISPECIES: DUF397 domain-containing protein [Actinoplanes]MCM4079399.1 DUF397 domain-containing protein [Actinoplanes hotanensis]